LKLFNFNLKVCNAGGTEINIYFKFVVFLSVVLGGKENRKRFINKVLSLLELQVPNSQLNTVPYSFFHLQQSTLHYPLPYNLET